jgi:hypothetical protein
MSRKILVVTAVPLLILGVVIAYLTLTRAPVKGPPSDNVLPGAVTKAGILERDETWSGEVLIVESVEVPAGVTLSIKPGTVVKFKHYRHEYQEPDERLNLIVDGKLVAIGTPEQPIWFTSDADDPMNGDWNTIHFHDAEDGSVIKYAIVEFAEHSNISLWNSSPTISHVISRWNNSEGIYMESNCSPIIEYCMIYQNGFNGIAMEQFNENVRIRYNYIAYNGSSGIHHMASSSVIEHNVIVGNQNGISFMDNSFALARYNTIRDSRGAAIWSETGDSSAVFLFNTVENNAFGLGGLSFAPFELHFNNFLNHQGEILLEEAEATGVIRAENNWWGTPDEAEVAEKISFVPPVVLSHASPLTGRVVENPGTGERITENLAFDYADRKPYELGYTPGDPELDRYPWVLPDDETRRILRRLSSGDEMPWSLAWGENHLWVAHNLGILKLDSETGEVLAQFPNPGTRPWGMAFDGEHLWLNDFTELELLEVSPETGEVFSRFSYADLFPGALNGLAWDGEHLCLTDWGEPGIVKFDRLGNFIEKVETEAWVGCGLTFDGENFWAPAGGERIYKISPTGEVIGWITAGSSIGTWDLAWDGEHLWTGERTYEVWADNKIFEMEILEMVPWTGS